MIFLSRNKSRPAVVWNDGRIQPMKNKYFNETRYLAADSDHIDHNHENDGVDRRGFLKCMAWAGTGMLWTVSGGVLGSKILSPVSASAAENPAGALRDF